MKQFEIKITGSGTKEEILIALNKVADYIEDTNIGIEKELEDATLMTVISLIEK